MRHKLGIYDDTLGPIVVQSSVYCDAKYDWIRCKLGIYWHKLGLIVMHTKMLLWCKLGFTVVQTSKMLQHLGRESTVNRALDGKTYLGLN